MFLYEKNWSLAERDGFERQKLPKIGGKEQTQTESLLSTQNSKWIFIFFSYKISVSSEVTP